MYQSDGRRKVAREVNWKIPNIFSKTIDKLEFSSYDASKINKSVELLKGAGDMKVMVKVYDEVKYSPFSEKVAEVEYDGVKGFDVVSDPAAVDEIESMADAASIDENHEYLVIYFENGETSTFGNSHVDLFRI